MLSVRVTVLGSWWLKIEEDELLKVWRANFDPLSNKEWLETEGLTDVSPV